MRLIEFNEFYTFLRVSGLEKSIKSYDTLSSVLRPISKLCISGEIKVAPCAALDGKNNLNINLYSD